MDQAVGLGWTRRVLAAGITVLAALLMGHAALTAFGTASAEEIEDIIHACYSNGNGLLRVVSGPGGCRNAEQEVQWAAQGSDGELEPPGDEGTDFVLDFTTEIERIEPEVRDTAELAMSIRCPEGAYMVGSTGEAIYGEGWSGRADGTVGTEFGSFQRIGVDGEPLDPINFFEDRVRPETGLDIVAVSTVDESPTVVDWEWGYQLGLLCQAVVQAAPEQ